MKILIVVQARTGSSRLPGKVLLPAAGKSILARQLERIHASREADEIVVATTTLESDSIIARVCQSEGVACFRGHPTDCLDRHYHCGMHYHADVVVKIPGDCPLIDPRVIDRILLFYRNHAEEYDYVSNLHPPSYPDGNDVEVIPMYTLEAAWNYATKSYEREHTTPYIWDNPSLFRIGNVLWEKGLDYSMTHRWVLDYEADYHFIRRVYEELYSQYTLFTTDDILRLTESNREIPKLNSHYAGVNWYSYHLDELRTVTQESTRVMVYPPHQEA